MALRDPIDPTKIYQVNNQASPLTCSTGAAVVGNNQSIIAAISGQRIRVMGLYMQSTTGTVGSAFFKSNSGGTALFNAGAVPATTAGNFTLLPIVDAGYFETLTGQGLFADITAGNIYITVFYITYTP